MGEIKKLRINSGWEKLERGETDWRMEKERKEGKEKDLRHELARERKRETEIGTEKERIENIRDWR